MREGDLIAGRYRLVRPAGAGGMGAVYEAVDADSGARVALKTLIKEAPFEPRRQARLFREARALSELAHPAVVRLLDHGVTADDTPFLVMEWIAGETLAARLNGGGVAPFAALALVARLAGGLRSVHERGVVHRDLKPSNVLLPKSSVTDAVLVDFGVARIGGGSDLTSAAGYLGTPRYMAPEQIRSARTVDGKADVFALGCILFECLTGLPCFDAEDPIGALSRVLFETTPAPTAIRPELPRFFDEFVGELLERDVARRPTASQAEVRAQALLAGLTSEDHRLPPQPARPLAALPRDAVLAASTVDDEPAPASLAPGATAIVGAAARVLPEFDGLFVGGFAARDRIVELLSRDTPVVSVWGGPGVGKSRLVVEAVRTIAARDASGWDALVYADLADALDADDVVRLIAREASMALEASSPPELALGRALGKLGRVLLVLDPVDAVLALLPPVLRAFGRVAPGIRTLTVSRRRFAATGGTSFELLPLSTVPLADEPSPAATLLLDRLARTNSSALEAGVAHPALAVLAEHVATELDGVPLALELAAANASVLGLDGLLARLSGTNRDRQNPLRAPLERALQGSWEMLDEDERSALAQCAVFRGGFTVEAAEHVVRLPSGAPILGLVRSLRDHALLRPLPLGDGRVRLSLFRPVLDFARDRLARTKEAPHVFQRHAHYYGVTFREGSTLGADERAARVERDADNLLAAAEYSLGETDALLEPGLGALVALEPSIFARGVVPSYLALLDHAVAVAGERGGALEPLLSDVRQIRARFDAPAGRNERARADLSACLETARRLADVRREGHVLLDLGVVAHLERALGEARTLYESALSCLARVADPDAEGRAIGNVGALEHDEGDLPSAARSYRKAMVLLERAGDGRRLANVAGNLALVEQERGLFSEARTLYAQAREILETVRDARLLAIVLGNLGVLELELGRHAEALSLHEHCVRLLDGSPDRRSRALSFARLGATLALLDRPAEAEAAIASGERLGRDAGPAMIEVMGLARAFVELAWARDAIRRGDEGDAAARTRVARERLTHALDAVHDGQRVLARSDDVRAMIRILTPQARGEPLAART